MPQVRITKWVHRQPLGKETQVEGFIVWVDPVHKLRLAESRTSPGNYSGWRKTLTLSKEVGKSINEPVCVGKFHRLKVMTYRTTGKIISVDHQH
jgi:hypothetical protein